jgi:pyruvate dehydrogenase E2 component (dihydrolipoamide acetyltransferase)
MENLPIHALTMPKWGLSMKKGHIAAWLVDEGCEVGPGVEVVDIETEKVTSGLEPAQAGILRRKVVGAGAEIPVGGLIGIVADRSVTDTEIESFVAEFCSHSAAILSSDEAAGPVPQQLQVNGLTLRYLVHGEGGQPAILLHGFGGDLNNWLFNHEAVAADRTVYAIDLPGHGKSSRLSDFRDFSAFANAVAAFMDSRSITRAHVGGHSMGGAIALQLALSHPGRVRSLTLLASAGLGTEIDGEYIEGFISANRRKEIKPFLDRLFADPSLVSKQLVDDILKFKRMDGTGRYLRLMADCFWTGGKQSFVLRDCLATLPMPLLAVWGCDDRIIPATHARGLPSNVETHLIPEAGHMVQMEAAPKLNRLLQSFWSRVEP